MSKTAVIVTGKYFEDFYPHESSFYIGVESGCLTLLNHSLPLEWAIGDFDHVTKQQFNKIKQIATNLKIYSPQKDWIDGELAVDLAIEQKADSILLFAEGNRLDMNLASLSLVWNKKITVYHPNFEIKLFSIGTHIIDKPDRIVDFSLFTLCETIVTLQDFAFNVEHFKLTPLSINAMCNSWIKSKSGLLTVEQGNVLLIGNKR